MVSFGLRSRIPRLTFGLTLAILAFSSGVLVSPSTAAPKFDGRVIVQAMEYPWSALGRVNAGGRSHCTGVLISERHVLTKAHCLYYPTEGRWWAPSELHFVAGYQRDIVRVHSTVAAYRVATAFSAGGEPTLADFTHDWALLTLSKPIGRQAGWMKLQWLDDHVRHGLAQGEAYLLEAGYRRGQAHVVTVSLNCDIDSKMRHRLVSSRRCGTFASGAGLSTLLFVDGAFRVLGTPSMQRDAMLRTLSTHGANPGRIMAASALTDPLPRETMHQLLDSLDYKEVAADDALIGGSARPLRAVIYDAPSDRGTNLATLLAAQGNSGGASGAITAVAFSQETSLAAVGTAPQGLRALDVAGIISAVNANREAKTAATAGRQDRRVLMFAGRPAIQDDGGTNMATILAMRAPRKLDPAAVVQDGRTSGLAAPAVSTSGRGTNMATILAMRAPRKLDPAAVVQDGRTSGLAAAATRKSSGTGDPAARRTPGDYVVQLASFSSPQGAERGRTTLQRRLSDLLSGAEMFVAEATLADTRTVYRVRMGPFASLAEARDACARFRAHSHDCLVMQ